MGYRDCVRNIKNIKMKENIINVCKVFFRKPIHFTGTICFNIFKFNFEF